MGQFILLKLSLLGLGIFASLLCFKYDQAYFEQGEKECWISYTMTVDCQSISGSISRENLSIFCHDDSYCQIIESTPILLGISTGLAILTFIQQLFENLRKNDETLVEYKIIKIFCLTSSVILLIIIPFMNMKYKYKSVKLDTRPILLECVAAIFYFIVIILTMQDKKKDEGPIVNPLIEENNNQIILN